MINYKCLFCGLISEKEFNHLIRNKPVCGDCHNEIEWFKNWYEEDLTDAGRKFVDWCIDENIREFVFGD